ncbi:MAG: TPM domain-containing protein [Candidatus Zixiibacteriota bacterium]
MKILGFAFCIAWLLASQSAIAAYDGPLVVDDANFLDGAQLLELTYEVKAVNSSNDFFLVILTTPSLDGQKIETFSRAILQVWNIGHEGRKDGILLLVVKQDTTFHFQAGTDVENLLSDAHFGYIIDLILKPAFERRDFLNGLVQAVRTLPTEIEKPNRLLYLWVIPIAIVMVILYSNTLNRRRRVCPHCKARVSPVAIRCPKCLGDIRSLRDDPCPCGSKKSYGHCCLEKHIEGRCSHRIQFLRYIDIRFLKSRSTGFGGFTAGGTCELPASKPESKDFDGTGVVGGW